MRIVLKFCLIAKKYHPDTMEETENEKSKELFKDITEAYSVLGDPDKRARYD
jgi:curved DNA-binding protein